MAKEAVYREENEGEEIPAMPMEAADDWCIYGCIEKVASVVAWTPSAELFFMQIMQGNREFDFMIPGNAYYTYYIQRIEVLRLRPCPLYNEKFSASFS